MAVAAGVLCSEGFVRLDLRENRPEGQHIFVIAPAMIAPVAVHWTPEANLREAAYRVRPWLPIIRAAWRRSRHRKI
jgi:hypothetical protein